MNYSDFKTDDFIADEKFINWVNAPTDESNLFWKKWMQNNPAKINEVKEAKVFIQSLEFDEPILSTYEVNDLLQNIHQDIHTTPIKTPQSKLRSLRWWSIAATFALLIGSSFWWYLNSTNIYTTAFNETQTLELPDGTEVILNANSSVETKKDWATNADREIWLEGEAFFHVTKTPSIGNRKFIVHAKDVDVEVLGTEFNVNARQDETSIVLKSGMIQLVASQNVKNASTPITVTPGERVVVASKELIKSNVNTEVYTSWTSKKIVLDKTPFSHIVDILKHNYGFQVQVKDEDILEKKLTGTAPLNNDPKILLNSLGAMFDLSIEEKENGEIFIQKK